MSWVSRDNRDPTGLVNPVARPFDANPVLLSAIGLAVWILREVLSGT
jgi:hypothetical protein